MQKLSHRRLLLLLLYPVYFCANNCRGQTIRTCWCSVRPPLLRLMTNNWARGNQRIANKPVFCPQAPFPETLERHKYYSSYYFKDHQAYLLILNGFIELVNCTA